MQRKKKKEKGQFTTPLTEAREPNKQCLKGSKPKEQNTTSNFTMP